MSIHLILITKINKGAQNIPLLPVYVDVRLLTVIE